MRQLSAILPPSRYLPSSEDSENGIQKLYDVNYYPVPEARRSKMRHRPPGLGVQGLTVMVLVFTDAFRFVRSTFS